VTYSPQQRANLPSRTGPVIVIVLGALAMLLGPLIGLLVGIGGLIGNLDLEELANSQQIANGSAATLPADSEWMVIPQNPRSGYSCDVTGPGGRQVDVASREGIVFFSTNAAGEYVIRCDGASGTLTVFPAADLDRLIQDAPGAATSVVLGFVAGFLGFVALIAGIVWLVRVNRDRRDIQYGGYGGPGGYGGYGGPGGYGPPGGGYTTPGGYPPAGGYTPGSGGYQPGGGYPPSGYGQSPTGYGQSPTEPPRYGERIDPQNPPYPPAPGQQG